MRKDTRPSPALPYWKRRKAGQGLGMRLLIITAGEFTRKPELCVSSGKFKLPFSAFSCFKQPPEAVLLQDTLPNTTTSPSCSFGLRMR